MTVSSKALLLLLLSVASTVANGIADKPKIAVIGAGIGGTSTAFYLRELFQDSLDIDIYESGHVGGRLDTISVGDREYESGGSIIHPRNHYMVNFTSFFGLEHAERNPGGKLSIYDGEQMVFDGSTYSLGMIGKLFWHYGWDIFKIRSFVSDLMEHFTRIYDHQDDQHSFTTVENLLASMSPGFVDDLEISIANKMKNAGFQQRLIDELVMGGLQSNYGQTIDIQAFVGSVSMAGVESGLWSVKGGNKLVAEKLLEASKANLIKSKVTNVARVPEKGAQDKFIVETEKGKSTYDIVVLALPLVKYFTEDGELEDETDIEFDNFDFNFSEYYHRAHRTVATFVKGVPRFEKFGYSSIDDFPTEMFVMNASLFYNSIGNHVPVDYNSDKDADLKLNVYKVFSRVPLTPEQYDELFKVEEEIEIADWLAYPQYTKLNKKIAPFEIQRNFYYVNSIELAASAMEMSCISGRNVAILAYNRWNKRDHLVDSVNVLPEHSQEKAEL